MKFRLDRTSYFTAHRKKGTERRVLVLVVILILLYVGGFALARFTGPLVRLISYPLVEAGNALTTRFPDAFAFFTFRKQLIGENAKLKEEVEKANIALLRLKDSEQSVVELRSRLGYHYQGKTPIVARVISKPDQNAYDVITLDIGDMTSAVKSGDLVVVDNTVALGVVDTVTTTMTKVRLFSSPQLSTPVLIGAKRIPASATGQGGGSFSVMLPRDLEITASDLVVSTSTSHYLLGTVGSVNSDPSESFQTILFRSPVNFINVNWVEIYAR